MRALWRIVFLVLVGLTPVLSGCGSAQMSQESAREEALREAEEMAEEGGGEEDLEEGDSPGE